MHQRPKPCNIYGECFVARAPCRPQTEFWSFGSLPESSERSDMSVKRALGGSKQVARGAEWICMCEKTGDRCNKKQEHMFHLPPCVPSAPTTWLSLLCRSQTRWEHHQTQWSTQTTHVFQIAPGPKSVYCIICKILRRRLCGFLKTQNETVNSMTSFLSLCCKYDCHHYHYHHYHYYYYHYCNIC